MSDIDDLMDWEIDPTVSKFLEQGMKDFNNQERHADASDFLCAMVNLGLVDLLWNPKSQKKYWGPTPAFFRLNRKSQTQRSSKKEQDVHSPKSAKSS